MIYIQTELSHHGVKGVKWGVRHDPIRKGHRRIDYKIDGSYSISRTDVYYY